MLQVAALEEVKSIREIIYIQLREAIISGAIQSGERLVEVEVAEQLNVSRTPVREAIRMLASDGLVESFPRRGVVVKGIGINDVIEIYKIRQALEVMAFKSAVEFITPVSLTEARRHIDNAQENLQKGIYDTYYRDNESFTELIVETSRMPRAVQLISSYRDQLRSFRKITLSDPDRREEAVRQHINILDAIAAKDVELVGKLVFEHIEGALNVCKRYREKKL